MDNNNINPSNEEDNIIFDHKSILDDQLNPLAVLAEKLADARTPGFFQTEFDPEEAELAGAFIEDALSERDASDSSIDLIDTFAHSIDVNNITKGD